MNVENPTSLFKDLTRMHLSWYTCWDFQSFICNLHQALSIMCNSPIEFFSLFNFEDQREEKVQKKNKQTPIHPHVKIKKFFNFQLHVKQKYYVKKVRRPQTPIFLLLFLFSFTRKYACLDFLPGGLAYSGHAQK